MTKRINYWNFNYMPEWEAASKEVQTLVTELHGPYHTQLVAMNMKRRQLVLKGRIKHIPFPYGLALLPFLKPYAAKFDVNHIYASLSEPLLLKRIKGPKTILTATKDDSSLAKVEKNLPHLKELPFVVVESELHREYLIQNGLERERVALIYPGKAPQAYKAAEGPFKILFATSPRGPNEFFARGIHLMLDVAQELPEVRFVFAWRKQNLAELDALIKRHGLKNIEVHNGVIEDMGALYDQVHTTILPGLTANSIKPCPHSALDSLAHGKPVLVSRPMSISGLVERQKCGVVFEPATEDLIEAIKTLKDAYEDYQSHCHSTVKAHFSPAEFLARYRRIYDAV